MEGDNQDQNQNKIIDPTIKKGFTNFGNTCFYNATLQCLFRCTELMNKLKDYKQPVEILPDGTTTVNPKPTGLKLLKYLQITIEDYYLKPQVEEIGPVLLLRSYREMNQNYIGGTQDCARECLTYFIDNFIDASKKEDIHIAELFDCDLKSEIICPLCNNKTESNAPEKVINLPIKNQNTFEDAMNLFLNDEKLDDDNKYNCEKCNQKVNANKKLIIKKTPKYLFIALKRFEFEYIKEINKIKASKINDDIIMPYVTTINGVTYELKGCIYHMGNLNGGHYIYYHKFNTQWVEFNDDIICDEQNMNRIINKGYIYLYERVE